MDDIRAHWFRLSMFFLVFYMRLRYDRRFTPFAGLPDTIFGKMGELLGIRHICLMATSYRWGLVVVGFIQVVEVNTPASSDFS